jgi:hypothetical protein
MILTGNGINRFVLKYVVAHDIPPPAIFLALLGAEISSDRRDVRSDKKTRYSVNSTA